MAKKRGEPRDWLKLDRIRQDDGTFKSYRDLCEDAQPTKARALIAYIDLGLDGPPQSYRGNHGRQRPKSRKRGHPAAIAAAERRRSAVPDETEKQVQLWKHKVGRAVREGESPIEGLLRPAAEYMAPQLQVRWGLVGEEHRAAIVEWLVGVWGDCVNVFPTRPDLPGYLEWRERSRAHLAAVA